jgi:adenylate kinase
MQSKTFIFFGVCGSGKGTQVELLLNFLKEHDQKEILCVSTGNEYRKLIVSNSYTGSLIKDSMARGELQPNFLTNTIVLNLLVSSLEAEKNLVIDGYPRTVEQSISLEKALKFFKREEVKIIHLSLSRDEAMKRNLLRGRSDDNQAGILHRIDKYYQEVVPAMHYFDNKTGYTLYEINGEQSIQNVHQDIIKF